MNKTFKINEFNFKYEHKNKIYYVSVYLVDEDTDIYSLKIYKDEMPVSIYNPSDYDTYIDSDGGIINGNEVVDDFLEDEQFIKDFAIEKFLQIIK
jgi:hypothetical protein